MRLHRLEVSGIGPFAERQVVDFDRLNEAGLFLLSGPTGSGKTSVLDAVSIALFGQPPGVRKGRRDLVSHHRDPEAAPEVRLEATVGGRRIRVTRTPAHTRPKKRGEGETEENPSVALEVAGPDGGWQPVSSRIAEADRQLREWIGMDHDQFAQVVMLPQGEFATFLRADAKERRRVLERLFPSHDFAFVEDWLRRRAGKAREERDEKRAEIDRRLAAAAAVAGQEGDSGSPERVGAWVEATKIRLETAVAAAAEVQEEAQAEFERADGHRRAARDREQEIAARDQEAKRAAADWDRARAELSGRPGGLTVQPEIAELPTEPGESAAAEVRQRERDLRAVIAELEAFERDQLARAEELSGVVRGIAAQIERAEREKTELAASQAEAPERIAKFESALREAEGAAAGLAAAEQNLATVADRLASARRRDGLAPQLRAAEEAVQEERELAVVARERWLHLREARLAGIAAELSSGLASGEPCPVCGALDHPAPAAGTEDAPSKEAEAEAEDDLASRERAVEEARARLDALRQEFQQFDGRAGGAPVAELAARHESAERECQGAREKAERRGGLVAELRRLRDRQDEATERLAEIDREVATLAERRKAAEREVGEIREREDVLRADDPGVPARRERLKAAADLLHEAAGAAVRGEAARKARRAAEAIELEVPLEQAQVAYAAAAEQLEAATARLATARNREADFAREAAALPVLMGEYEPLVEAAATASELAGLALGNNPARLQLSTYVLAARLEQVIEAANVRLTPMSSGRYRLVYSAELAARGAMSGLGIRVFDSYTGLEREPTSLSGGESFYASLSLALGLAEVVQRESGGRRLETLFIDEGFGTLDSDTLDQVMSVLDELREGGRVVGVVSHVEELKNRIPSRIEVTPSPSGSRLSLLAA